MPGVWRCSESPSLLVKGRGVDLEYVIFFTFSSNNLMLVKSVVLKRKDGSQRIVEKVDPELRNPFELVAVLLED